MSDLGAAPRSGARLGPYEIGAKLGEGGMGEVWRATDSRLRREVAIKVLPAAVTGDRERLARFEREAQTLAALNHPNVAAIYGLEESDGTYALVMELVEGEELSALIARGPLPLDEALAIARQIAEALEAAHEQGIVHRDLKPANVKVRHDGTVKVLDFGLAKAMEPTAGAGGPASLAHSPTITSQGTQLGVILGTAAYMSPEQARGKAVDKRADIWAFGVVFHEMLTGRRLFEGDSVSDTLAGVLKNEIDLSALPPATPAAIRRLLRRCLERAPKNRLRDIGDARIAIEEVLAGGGADAAGASTAAPGPMPSIGRLAPWALVLLLLGGGAGWLASRAAAPAPAESKGFALRRLTELPGLESQPDLSPDGRQVVYSSAASGNRDVYVMRAEGGRAINITAGSPAADEQATFSPDGDRLVFRSSRDGGGLFLMGATGESVRRLTDGGFDPAWAPDGARVAYSMEAVIDPYSRDVIVIALWIVDVATGEKRQRLPGDAVQPAWSPDGRRIAYWANTEGQRDLWTVAVESGEPVAVTADAATDWSPEWSPDGRWLYFSSDRAGSMNLFRVAIDPATGGASGAPEQITTSVGNLGWFRFSADGRRLVAAAYEQSAELHLHHLTPGAAPTLQPLRTLRTRFLQWCRLAPDGEWLACSTIGTPEDLVLLRADGSELRRLTDDPFKDRNLSWSPDGTRLAFYSTRSGAWNLWTVRADGSELRRIADPPDTTASAWSLDGQRLMMDLRDGSLGEVAADRFTARDAMRSIPLPEPLRRLELGGWSPSGELLGGTEADPSGALSIGAFEPATGTYRRSQLPMAGAEWVDAWWKFAGWLPDSRHFVASGREQIAVVNVETGAWRGLQAVEERRLNVSLSRDGRTLLVEQESVDGDLWMLEIPWGKK